MKTNHLVVLALSAIVSALTTAPAESTVKVSAANPSAVEQKVIVTTHSTYGTTQSKALVPNVSILDKPITLKIEILPLIHSDLPREVSVLVSPK